MSEQTYFQSLTGINDTNDADDIGDTGDTGDTGDIGDTGEQSSFFEGLPSHIVVGDDDRQMVQKFADHMTDKGATPEFMHEAVAWYNALDADNVGTYDDGRDRHEAETLMRDTWGDNYDSTVNSIIDMVDESPVADFIFEARLPDGSLLMNNPMLLEWLGEAVNAAADDNNIPDDNEGEVNMETKAEIEELMRDRSGPYWKGPRASALQERYMQLVDPDSKPASRQVRSQSDDKEIAKIQALMRDRGSAYWKGPRAAGLQRRYLKMLEARGR